MVGRGAPDVALFMPDFGGGGAERMMTRLARALADRGRRVEIVVCAAEGPFVGQAGDAVRVIDFGGRRVLAALPAIVAYLRDRRPRAVLVTLDYMSVVVLLARWLARVQVRLVVRQANDPTAYRGGSLRDRVAVAALRRLLPTADAVVSGSRGVAASLRSWTRVPPERLHVVGNPVVDATLAELAEQPVDHPFLVSPGPPVVLAAGRFTPQKDFRTLLQAFASARRRRPLRLIVLGEGPGRPDLEAFVRDQNLTDAVSLPGFVGNPFAYMRRSHVFVLSSAWEGLPGVLIQAMACGCPVVSTDCPSGPREILDDGRLGPLVPVGDAGALADAILSRLDAPRGAEALREAAAVYAVDRSVALTEAVLWPTDERKEGGRP